MKSEAPWTEDEVCELVDIAEKREGEIQRKIRDLNRLESER